MISEPLLMVRRNALLNCPSTHFSSLTPFTWTISPVKLSGEKHTIDSTCAHSFDRGINQALQIELAMAHCKLFWFATPDEGYQKAVDKPIFMTYSHLYRWYLYKSVSSIGSSGDMVSSRTKTALKIKSPDPSSSAFQSDVDDCVIWHKLKVREHCFCLFRREIRRRLDRNMLRRCKSNITFKGFYVRNFAGQRFSGS